MAVDAFAEKLGLILHHRALPASRFSSRDRIRLQGMFDAGVLVEEKSGAGRRVVLINDESFTAFIFRHFPSGLEGIATEMTPRSRAVMEHRDSKKSREVGPTTVLLRGFGDVQLSVDDQVLQVGYLTRIAGVAALQIGGEKTWGYSGSLAIVENLEVFWNIEKTSSLDLALYAQGRLNQKTIDWLASPAMAEAHIVHFGDYDPVGLDEYLRLKKARPRSTRLYAPENLETLLKQYGKKELLADSVAVLERLRKTDDPDVEKIVKMMDRWGVGLEQEVLLSKNGTSKI